MLPIPSATKLIPTWYQQGMDPARDAMTAKLDAHLAEWTQELVELSHVHRPDRCASALLGELAYMLGVTLLASDSDQAQRLKIANAETTRANLGLWATCIAPLVNAVTGTSCVVWAPVAWDWEVSVEGSEAVLATAYWATSGEGDDPNITGEIVAEADVEPINPGNVYIDTQTGGSLGAASVAAIVLAIGYLVPAYFRVYVGYTTSGAFTTYAGGVING